MAFTSLLKVAVAVAVLAQVVFGGPVSGAMQLDTAVRGAYVKPVPGACFTQKGSKSGLYETCCLDKEDGEVTVRCIADDEDCDVDDKTTCTCKGDEEKCKKVGGVKVCSVGMSTPCSYDALSAAGVSVREATVAKAAPAVRAAGSSEMETSVHQSSPYFCCGGLYEVNWCLMMIMNGWC